MAVEKPDQPGQRYRCDRRMRQRRYRIEGTVKAAAGDAGEIPGKQKAEDLALPVAQDPVADRDPLDDQKYGAAPSSLADNLLPRRHRAADRFQVEQSGCLL